MPTAQRSLWPALLSLVLLCACGSKPGGGPSGSGGATPSPAPAPVETKPAPPAPAPAPQPPPPLPRRERQGGLLRFTEGVARPLELKLGAEGGLPISCGSTDDKKQIYGQSAPGSAEEAFDGIAFTLPREAAVAGKEFRVRIGEPKPDLMLEIRLRSRPAASFLGECRIQLGVSGELSELRLSCPSAERQDNRSGQRAPVAIEGFLSCPVGSLN